MISKQKPAIFLAGFVLLSGLFYFLTSFEITRITEIILGACFMYSSSVVVGLFFCLFVKEVVFQSWVKFALIWTVFIFLAFLISAQPGNGFIPNPVAFLAPLTLALFILSTPIYLYIKSR